MKQILFIIFLVGCSGFYGCHKSGSGPNISDIIEISGCYLVGDSMTFANHTCEVDAYGTPTGSGGPFTTTYWNFGDGSTSTQSSPAHIYASAGTYTVTTVVSGKSFSDVINITNPPLSSPYTISMAGTRQWVVYTEGDIILPGFDSAITIHSFQVVVLNSSTIKLPYFDSNTVSAPLASSSYQLTVNDTVNKVLTFSSCLYIPTTIQYYYATDSITYGYTWAAYMVSCEGESSGTLSMHTL